MVDFIKKNSLSVIALGLFVICYPLILKAVNVPILPEDIKYFGIDKIVNVFHVGKVWTLIGFTGLMVFSLGSDLVTKASRKFSIDRPACVFLSIYTVLTVASWYLSLYKDLGWRGATDRFEGLPVIICYIVICIVTALSIKTEENRKYIVVCLSVSAVVMGIIGFGQMIGYNPLELKWVKMLIAGAEYDQLSYREGSFVFGTIGNPNFYGSFFAVTLPFVLIRACSVTTKISKVIYTVACIVCFTALLGSSSRAAFTAMLIVMPVISYYITANSPLATKSLRLILVLSFGAFCITRAVLGGKVDTTDLILLNSALVVSMIISAVSAQLRAFFSRINPRIIMAVFVGIVILSTLVVIAKLPHKYSNDWPLGKMERISDNKLNLMIYGDVISIEYNSEKLTIVDQKGKSIVDASKLGRLDIKLPSGRIFKAQYTSDKNDKRIRGLVFDDPYFVLILANAGDGSKVLLTDLNFEQSDIVSAKSFSPLYGLEGIGSGRGYIWSRTIPLLYSRMLVGSGPDSFTPSFPQLDYVGKSSISSNLFLIVDKPHNWYLQMGVQSGVAASLAIIALIIRVLMRLRRDIADKITGNEDFSVELPVFASILGYSLTNLFNDSVVGVAPLFWIVMGIGIAMLCISGVAQPIVTRIKR